MPIQANAQADAGAGAVLRASGGAQLDASRDTPIRLDRRAIAATVAGNALEFYDFLSYSFFAVYIGKAFFPSGNALTSLLLSLATFGVGFFTRPLGGLLIGAYADRAGRRPALVVSISLMAGGTLALVTAALTLLSTLSAAAALAAVTEIFPSEVRSSGLAISYAASASLFGGTTQFAVAWLIGATGDPLAPAWYVILTSAVSLWAMFGLPETGRA